MEALKHRASQAIETKSEELYALSMDIWNNPELCFQEHRAHDLLTAFLERNGFHVLKETPLQTSFVAKFGNGSGPKIGICCEYDALPGIGHGCGHNLIAEAGVATAIGVKSVLAENPSIPGDVIVYGTPAEEEGGGKVLMLEKGAFDDCDVCMMVHPAPYDIPDPVALAFSRLSVVFTGTSSNSATWDGVSALDCAVACYTSVSMMRQQLRPTSRVHMIIAGNGSSPDIVPRRVEVQFGVRGLTNEDAMIAKRKVIDCAEAAAAATGCAVHINDDFPVYESLRSNSVLLDLYIRNGTQNGLSFDYSVSRHGGSTDMGNVSNFRPTIHPKFKIACEANIHTQAFADAARLPGSQSSTLKAGKTLACVAIDC